MQIICPECKFAREVDENKIPPRSQIATCPKCQTKFKFRELPEQDFVIEEPAATEPVEPKAPLKQPHTESPKSEPERTFPEIQAPGEKPKDDLWKRLDAMTPPEPKADQTSAQKPGSPAQHNDDMPVDGWTGEFNSDFPDPMEKPKIYYPPGAKGQPEEHKPEEQKPVDGWTGEFNEDFPDPMQAERNEEGPESDVVVPPPFEQLDRYGFFGGLFATIKLILFSPRLFFSVMPVGGGLSKPLTFAILVSMIQALAQFAWGAAGLVPGFDLTTNGVETIQYNTTNGLFELLLTPAMAAISIYFISGFYHLILSLLKAGDKGFEGSFRAVAYAYAPMVTGIIPLFNMELMGGWMLLNAIWGVALTAIGLKHIHKTSYGKVIPVMLIPLLLAVILTVAGMQSQLPTM